MSDPRGVVKPKTQADVERNRRVIYDYIHGLAIAARRIAEEEKARKESQQ